MSCKMWWPLPDSNWGHTELQSDALPTELKSHILVLQTQIILQITAQIINCFPVAELIS